MTTSTGLLAAGPRRMGWTQSSLGSIGFGMPFLIGEAEEAFARALRAKCRSPACGTLDRAFAAASSMANADALSRPVVLLSPACASFDQFREFRGARRCLPHDGGGDLGMSITFARTDTSLLSRWWWTVDRWTVAALVLLAALGIVLTMAASPAVAERLNHSMPSTSRAARRPTYRRRWRSCWRPRCFRQRECCGQRSDHAGVGFARRSRRCSSVTSTRGDPLALRWRNFGSAFGVPQGGVCCCQRLADRA